MLHFNLLHTITNNNCSQSISATKVATMKIQMTKPSCAITLFAVSKDKVEKKEDTGKSINKLLALTSREGSIMEQLRCFDYKNEEGIMSPVHYNHIKYKNYQS